MLLMLCNDPFMITHPFFAIHSDSFMQCIGCVG